MSALSLPTSNQTFDLYLSQSLDRYCDMSPDEAYQAIYAEWPKQMAILLETILFPHVSNKGLKTRRFFQIGRRDGSGTCLFYPY